MKTIYFVSPFIVGAYVAHLIHEYVEPAVIEFMCREFIRCAA